MTQNKSGLNFAVVLLLALFVSVGFASAITGSIVGGKMTLSKELYPQLWQLNGKDTITIEKYIIVRNKNDLPLNISLRPDENASKFIEMVDTSFRLEPNTEQKAKFLVKIKDAGIYEGQIVVLFTPFEGKEAGVALPSSITVIAKKEGSLPNDETENKDTQNDEGNILDSVTGSAADVPGSGDGPNIGLILIIITSLLLIVILVFLIFMMNKNKSHTVVNGKKDAEEIKKAVSKNTDKKRGSQK